jgi:hypothetical protein
MRRQTRPHERKARRRSTGSGPPFAAVTGPALAAVIGPALAAVNPPELGLSTGELLAGLGLALVSAALINLGFLFQHRGLAEGASDQDGLVATLRGAIRSPSWLSGQALGWIGFGAQIVAVAIAPLSLVQAFAAGGLALSVPIAARIFGHRISRGQTAAVLIIAASLAVLPIGFSTARDHLHPALLALTASLAVLIGLAISAVRLAPLRAIAAGIFYGVADAAIKAVSVGLHQHGASALVSVWTVVAAVATFGGFLAFQTALRDGGPVGAISLMNAFAALVALACGLLAFGESLGTNLVAVVAHLGAIALVLGCVPVLAGAQAELARVGERGGTPEAGYPGSPLRAGYQAPG